MGSLKPITIVGGGVAGLTLGIGLRRYAIPVTLWETRHYPRHRVCGEFISGRGQNTLRRLGLLEAMQQAGGTWAKDAMFVNSRAGTKLAPKRLPQPALCLARFQMDELLARQFQKEGGELREGEKWSAGESEEGVVHASGRRAVPKENGCRWYGIKVHARNVRLAADLEMHLRAGGYVGMCRLKDEVVNICALFRRSAKDNAPTKSWQEQLRGSAGTILHDRLAQAQFDEKSFASVAGLSLQPHRAAGLEECCIGDALTMIPPVTGNGMSMGFESAELAVQSLATYSRGQARWSEAKKMIARDCDRRFRKRLKWASWLQWMMFAPMFRGMAGELALGSGALWRVMFANTR